LTAVNLQPEKNILAFLNVREVGKVAGAKAEWSRIKERGREAAKARRAKEVRWVQKWIKVDKARRTAAAATTATKNEKEEEATRAASNYMRLIRPLLFGPHRDRRFILNMDQMLVYFLMSTKRMLELVGKKTIHICTSTNDTRWATVAVTIVGDGTLLSSTIIFKEKSFLRGNMMDVLHKQSCNVPSRPPLLLMVSRVDG
jgi:hypothetical protein